MQGKRGGLATRRSDRDRGWFIGPCQSFRITCGTYAGGFMITKNVSVIGADTARTENQWRRPRGDDCLWGVGRDWGDPRRQRLVARATATPSGGVDGADLVLLRISSSATLWSSGWAIIPSPPRVRACSRSAAAGRGGRPRPPRSRLPEESRRRPRRGSPVPAAFPRARPRPGWRLRSRSDTPPAPA